MEKTGVIACIGEPDDAASILKLFDSALVALLTPGVEAGSWRTRAGQHDYSVSLINGKVSIDAYSARTAELEHELSLTVPLSLRNEAPDIQAQTTLGSWRASAMAAVSRDSLAAESCRAEMRAVCDAVVAAYIAVDKPIARIFLQRDESLGSCVATISNEPSRLSATWRPATAALGIWLESQWHGHRTLSDRGASWAAEGGFDVRQAEEIDSISMMRLIGKLPRELVTNLHSETHGGDQAH